jgi:hypothetical protein
MTYLVPHWLITVGGDAWSSTETWQFGVRATNQSPAVPADAQALANALATPTQTFFSHTDCRVNQYVRLMWIKVAWVLETGLYPADFTPGIYTYPTPVAGPNTTATLPQSALAVTLLTGIPRGRASKGRFYLPGWSPTGQADGRLTTTQADAVETAAKTWLNAIKATAQVTDIVVMSKLGTGTAGTVLNVGVGRVVDTQRRRRRKLKEERTPLAL